MISAVGCTTSNIPAQICAKLQIGRHLPFPRVVPSYGQLAYFVILENSYQADETRVLICSNYARKEVKWSQALSHQV